MTTKDKFLKFKTVARYAYESRKAIPLDQLSAFVQMDRSDVLAMEAEGLLLAKGGYATGTHFFVTKEGYLACK